MSVQGHWVVVTGVRDIGVPDAAVVANAIKQAHASGALGFIFGGARGVDTHALYAASQAGATRRVVIVPGFVTQQPAVAARITHLYATEIIECGLDLTRPQSFQRRNEMMLLTGSLRDPDERPVVMAFPLLGAQKGGTRNCMQAARQRGLDVLEFPLTCGVENGGVD